MWLASCEGSEEPSLDGVVSTSGAQAAQGARRVDETSSLGAYRITGGIVAGLPSSTKRSHVNSSPSTELSEKEDSPVDSVLEMFKETHNSLQKVKLLKTMAGMVPRGHPQVLEVLCSKILDSQETINVRQAAIYGMQLVGVRGQKQLVDTLIQCAENDTAHDVRSVLACPLSILCATVLLSFVQTSCDAVAWQNCCDG